MSEARKPHSERRDGRCPSCGLSPYERGIGDADISRIVAERNRLVEQLQTERREEWREGIVNVLDHEGNYLGCMGSETWAWTLDGGIKRLKEQLEAAHAALREIANHNGHLTQAGRVAREALNPASEPKP